MKKTISLLFLFALSGCFSTGGVAGKLSGSVTIKPEFASTLKPTDVLFLIVRAQQFGPPNAVKRVPSPTFPYNFVVGPEDSMMPGMGGFEKGSNLTVAARISRSGNAMPSPGDLEGVFENNPAHPGDGGVNVVIDRVR